MTKTALDTIKHDIQTNNIVLFMKGTADNPMCGFSARVIQILDHLGADYKDVNVLADENIRTAIKEYSDWPTIPQLYVKGEFIGGCDIVTEMFTAGELKALLNEKELI